MPETHDPLETLLRRNDPAARMDNAVSPAARATLLSHLDGLPAPPPRRPLWPVYAASAACLAALGLWRAMPPTGQTARTEQVALSTGRRPLATGSMPSSTGRFPDPSGQLKQPAVAASTLKGAPDHEAGHRFPHQGGSPSFPKAGYPLVGGVALAAPFVSHAAPSITKPAPPVREILVRDDSQKTAPAAHTDIAILGAGENLSVVTAVHEEEPP